APLVRGQGYINSVADAVHQTSEGLAWTAVHISAGVALKAQGVLPAQQEGQQEEMDASHVSSGPLP
ncbi:hypothetical protein, partial [Streptomyces sp. CHB9.2]|uniref:hypothetical protein n=1 Tax=Streptomyces sp. CHB9.2 TaxID=2841670 RepID=UPI002094792C